MRLGSFLTLTLLLAASCASRTNSQPALAASANGNAQQPTVESAQPAPSEIDQDAAEAEKEREVPLGFKEVDLENFSYPINWKGLKVRLKNGEYKYYKDKTLEGSGWFILGGVYYADVTGDGKKEAIVRLGWVDCGASCDGGSSLIYVYSSRGDKPALLWRIETGSLAYGCGLKSLTMAKQTITIEVFKTCHLEGVSLVSKSKSVKERPVGKFDPEDAFTRLLFEFDGRSFGLKEREVFPYMQFDVKGYRPEIRISDE